MATLLEQKKKITDKERDKILDKLFLTTKDIYFLLPDRGMSEATTIREQVLKKMEEQKYYISPGRYKLVNTKVFKEYLGL